MIKHILLIGSLMVSGIVSAEDDDGWFVIVVDPEAHTSLLNLSKINIIDSEKKILDIWVKRVLNTNGKSATELSTDSWYSPSWYILNNYHFDCFNSRAKLLQTIVSDKGEELSNEKPTYPTIVYPRSTNGIIMEVVCNNSFPKTTN